MTPLTSLIFLIFSRFLFTLFHASLLHYGTVPVRIYFAQRIIPGTVPQQRTYCSIAVSCLAVGRVVVTWS